MAKDFELEIFGPVGAGMNFLVWWACKGKGYFHRFQNISLDELIYVVMNEELALKNNQEVVGSSELTSGTTRILYCPETNEYQTNHPYVRVHHPFHFMF